MAKYFGFLTKLKSKSGILLFVVLWSMVILSALAISLGRSTSIELASTKFSLSQLQSKGLAWAGVIYGINQVRRDQLDSESLKQDTLRYCGIPFNENITLQDLFSERQVGEIGTFQIWHPVDQANDAVVSKTEIGETFSKNQNTVVAESIFIGSTLEGKEFGFSDEERKINLNSLNVQNYDVLVQLLEQFDVDQQLALQIAYSVVDWVDDNDVVSNPEYGAESEYYTGLIPAYLPKNKPLESYSELLLVRGMTPEILGRIKKFVTIFPANESLKVNLDTAPKTVLTAIARSYIGGASNSEVEDADSLVDKMIKFRSGDDRVTGTPDDKIFEINEMNLNAKEKVLFLLMSQLRTKKSSLFHFFVSAFEKNRGGRSLLETVVNQEDLSVVYWRRY